MIIKMKKILTKCLILKFFEKIEDKILNYNNNDFIKNHLEKIITNSIEEYLDIDDY